jgi:hypothetical protein
LSDCHAPDRGQEGDHAGNQDGGIERAVQAQAQRKRHREHERRCGDRLDELVLVAMNGLKKGSGGNDEHAGGAIQEPGDQANDLSEPEFGLATNDEAPSREPDDRVADEREPEQRRRNARVGLGDDADREQRPEYREHVHQDVPAHDSHKIGTSSHLPHVGQERGQNEDRRRCGRCKPGTQQAHCDRRQTKADSALHQARQHEHGDQDCDIW